MLLIDLIESIKDSESDPNNVLNDEVVDEIENTDKECVDEDSEHYLNDSFGLKFRCPFNQLDSFHAVESFPPVFLHDLLEGVVELDLQVIIKILVAKNWFSVVDYNKQLINHGWKNYEGNDKPKEFILKHDKLK